MNIFLGDNYLVSSSLRKITAVEKLRKRLERDERIYQNGSDFLYHALLDQVVDEFIPHIDQLEEEIDFFRRGSAFQP